MKAEVKVQLFVGVLGAIATIAASVIAANLQAKGTATQVAEDTATGVAEDTARKTVQDEIESFVPTLKIYPPIRTRRPTVQDLGNWQVCTLISAGESHARQACTCIIEKDDAEINDWKLSVSLDPSVNGQCNCQAACFNGLSEEQ